MNREMMKAKPIILLMLCQLALSITIVAIFIPFTAVTASGGSWDSGVSGGSAWGQAQDLGSGSGDIPEPGPPECVSGCGNGETGSSGNSNGNSWIQNRRQAQEARNRAKAFELNEKGNRAYKKKNWKAAIGFYKNALRYAPYDKVIRQNLKNAEYAFSDEKRKKRRLKLELEAKRRREKEARRKERERKRREGLARWQQLQHREAIRRKSEKTRRQEEGRQLLARMEYLESRLKESRVARSLQKQIDEINNKRPLNDNEIAMLNELEFRRNALWKKAVKVSGLTAEERERLRLRLHNTDKAFVNLSAGRIKKLKSQSPPVLVMIDDFYIHASEEYIKQKGEGIMKQLYGEKGRIDFGNFLGIAKIAIRGVKEGVQAGVAEAADFVVGKIPIPQASFAVEAGRQYANIVFQAETKFMKDAMKVAGGNFDSKQFWEQFKNDLSPGQRAMWEWVGGPHEY